MSIKRLPPESIETFSMVLHPKRRYSARASYLAVSSGEEIIPFGALATEASDPIVTEDSDFITTEN